MLDSDRKRVFVTSLGFGIYTLLIVPIYFSLPIYRIIDPLSSEILAEHTTRFGGIILFGGESTLLVLFFLVIIPLLILQGSRWAILATVVINGFFIPVEPIGILFLSFPPIPGFPTPYFERIEGCTLISCGLDHTLFHLSHLPFYAVMIFFSLRAYRSKGP